MFLYMTTLPIDKMPCASIKTSAKSLLLNMFLTGYSSVVSEAQVYMFESHTFIPSSTGLYHIVHRRLIKLILCQLDTYLTPNRILTW